MGRRMKSVMALLVVLVLLYLQQDQISYATEEERQMEPFEAVIPEVDGQNGYYCSYPTVEIRHVSETGTTHCRLTDSGGQVTEETLEEKGAAAVFGQERFREGKNELLVWMTDESEEIRKEYTLEQIFWIDTKGPVISLSTPQGTEVWYREETLLTVTASDGEAGSQTAELYCSAQGQTAGRAARDNAVFSIRQFSEGGAPVTVQVRATDRAGNVSWRECELFIDGKAPEIVLEGAHDYMITGQPVEMYFKAREENVLSKASGKVIWETPDGAVRHTDIQGWTETGDGREAFLRLEEEGSYQVSIEAQDGVGHTASADRRLVIDRTNPVIQYVDALDGTYQKSFCLDNKKGDLVQDFTTFTYTVMLDGRIYPPGETVDREGLHILEVRAVDAAGNTGTAAAEFVIDHTAPKVVFRELEEGEQYEEQKTFQVTLEDQKDQIQEIRINGIRQKTSAHGKIYQYTVEEARRYEVSVRASDRAGNETVERISFEIVPKETLAVQILNPIRKTLGIGKSQGRTEAEERGEKKSREKTPQLVTALAAGAGIATAGTVVWVLCRRRKER